MNDRKKQKILFIGGHATPAFAVLDELLLHDLSADKVGAERKTYDVIWVGEKHNQRGNKEVSAEYKTVKNYYKIPFIPLKSGKLVRKWTRKTFLKVILELLLLVWGFFKSFYIMLRYRPDVVITFGGFTAVPVVINAKLFRKKVLTHEQTIVTGLANKIIAKYADKICVSWKSSLDYFPKEKTVFTGNPIRKDVFEIRSEIFSKLNSSLPTIYITGGNQGAHEINKRIFIILEELLKVANVVHQTGNSSVTNDYKKASQLKNNIISENGKYIVRDYVGPDEIGEVMNKSDLIFSRSGANTISEILALGKLSILLPIPWASHDEQTENAKMVEDTGLAKRLVQDDKLSAEEILSVILEALENVRSKKSFNNKSIEEIREEAQAMIIPNAAELIYQEVIKLLNH